jgi:hypothetical protein
MDQVTGNAFFIFLVMHISLKSAPVPVQHIKPSTGGSNPEISRLVLRKAHNHVIAQATCVLFIILIHFELMSVVPVQSPIGPDPNEAFSILKNAVYVVIQQPVFNGKTFEMNRFVLGGRG